MGLFSVGNSTKSSRKSYACLLTSSWTESRTRKGKKAQVRLRFNIRTSGLTVSSFTSIFFSELTQIECSVYFDVQYAI